MDRLINVIRKLLIVLKFVASKAGKEYGVSHLHKMKLARRIIQNNKKVKSLSSWEQHLLLSETILKTPKSLEGDVVECGCYNGASTVNLSLACKLTNRKLIVCDSFGGLSKPKDDEKYEIGPVFNNYLIYEEGDYSSEGGLEGVKKNVEMFGNIEVCQFVRGYFKDTLKDLKTNSIVLIFEDVDLASSVEDCVRSLWPKLQENCRFYSHEPWSINIVSLFYDKKWWKDNLNTHPPGFYGSGNGVIFGLGYAKKFDAQKIKEQGKELHVHFHKVKGGWRGCMTTNPER